MGDRWPHLGIFLGLHHTAFRLLYCTVFPRGGHFVVGGGHGIMEVSIGNWDNSVLCKGSFGRPSKCNILLRRCIGPTMSPQDLR